MATSLYSVGIAALAVTALAGSTVVFASTGSNDVVSNKHVAPTWHLVWVDQFDGKAGSAPDPKKWTYDVGRGQNGDGWGNNELEYYTNSTKNAFLDGHGHLVIRALKQSLGGGEYTSARLVSHNQGNWKYGKIVVRAELPQGGQGIWPAIWMLPTKWVYGGWPNSGEIDIMEMIGSDPLTVHGTIHFGSLQEQGQAGDSYTLSGTGFHTYALVWSPNSIQWYVDGHLYETRTSSEWYTPGEKSPAPFDQSFHLLMNFAVGGNWPGNPDATVKFPQQMVVDYVRVYQQK